MKQLLKLVPVMLIIITIVSCGPERDHPVSTSNSDMRNASGVWVRSSSDSSVYIVLRLNEDSSYSHVSMHITGYWEDPGYVTLDDSVDVYTEIGTWVIEDGKMFINVTSAAYTDANFNRYIDMAETNCGIFEINWSVSGDELQFGSFYYTRSTNS